MKFIWTRSAVEKHKRGEYDLRHTISNVGDAAEGFIRQMRAGCPWLLVDDRGSEVRSGVGPQASAIV